jgi:cytochrome P450
VVKDTLERVVNAGEAELIGEVAQAIPSAVMGRLLGVPEAELRNVWPLTAALLADYDLPRKASSPALAKSMADAYFLRHLALARTREVSPLMTLLVEAQREHGIADEVLTDVCSRLLAAGSITTAGGIGNILARLLWMPADALPAEPNPSQREALVDELLRLETPVLGIKRRAEHDLELPDATIKKGQRVLLMTAAANRDPAYFPTPDSIDLTRGAVRHLSFGQGTFHCLGAPLARREISVLLELLLPLLPGIEVLRPPTRRVGWLLYEPTELWVKF